MFLIEHISMHKMLRFGVHFYLADAGELFINLKIWLQNIHAHTYTHALPYIKLLNFE